MRIMILSDRIPPENRGGGGLMAWRLAVGLRDSGHDVHVVAATDHIPRTQLRESIPTYHIRTRYRERFRPYLSLYNPQALPELRKLYKRIQPDVVNAHNIHSDLSYASISTASRMGFPTVFTSHDAMPFAYSKIDYFVPESGCEPISPQDYRLPPGHNRRTARLRYNPIRNIVIRHILLQHADKLTAPSQALCDAHQANDLPGFERVHNGINPITFSASQSQVEALRKRLALEGKKVILFAGRLTRPKGTIQLLDALQQVIADVPEAVVLVLSSIPIDQQITDSKYDTLKANHLKSGGWLDGSELAAAFHLADLIVSPSIILESFGMVLIEAMAAQKPVIASCYTGPTEIVVDGATGFLINPHDTAIFADRLKTLLMQPDLRQSMGQAGQERLLAHFTLSQQVDAMVDVYEQAIAHKKQGH
ncbi:MAG: hypothetical protein CL607_25460 [Anaerolineaceae bacterium]|nr:hypothetical protein [Anaerolineaceae bacterium]